MLLKSEVINSCQQILINLGNFVLFVVIAAAAFSNIRFLLSELRYSLLKQLLIKYCIRL